MGFYLIENMMGFENPVEQGSREDLEIRKLAHEREPAIKRVGSDSNGFDVKASYYIVPKEDWDIHNCPLIPVDLS
jgi:hypothetical protein